MIKGLQKITLIDYPGKIACTIFIGGCNFKCGYCYNSNLVLNIHKTPSISEEKILEFLKGRDGFLEGVCITGGEPTVWRGLIPLITKIRSLCFAVKLDTNGSNPQILKKIIENKLVDYIAMDIKASPLSYPKVIGGKANQEKIKQSIGLIRNSGIDHEFRTTVIPDIIDEQEIKEIAKLIGNSSPYFIQQFRPNDKTIDKRYAKMNPPSLEKIEDLVKIAGKTVSFVGMRNV